MATMKKILIGAATGVALIGATGAALADASSGARGEQHAFHQHHGHAGAMRMLERFDENKDGTVTRAEVDSVLAKTLEKFDTEGNQALSLKEFEGLWMEMTRQRMVRAFQHLDRDGDGLITAEELARPAERMFLRLDRDGDGQITIQELRERGKGARYLHRDDDRRSHRGGHR